VNSTIWNWSVFYGNKDIFFKLSTILIENVFGNNYV
jgi:hypothetical protein